MAYDYPLVGTKIAKIARGIMEIRHGAGDSGDTRLAEQAWQAEGFTLHNTDTGQLIEWPGDQALRILYIQAICNSKDLGLGVVDYMSFSVKAS